MSSRADRFELFSVQNIQWILCARKSVAYLEFVEQRHGFWASEAPTETKYTIHLHDSQKIKGRIVQKNELKPGISVDYFRSMTTVVMCACWRKKMRNVEGIISTNKEEREKLKVPITDQRIHYFIEATRQFPEKRVKKKEFQIRI